MAGVGISGIAWEVAEDEAVAAVLRARGVDAIDVAPGKYFPDLPGAGDAQIAQVRRQWRDRGFAVHGMQSLLFGTTGLNLFGSAEVQQRMLGHLDAVCRVGAGLGAVPLVFGSPKNRDRSAIADDGQVDEIAVGFFRRLGDIARGHGVVVCLEPNPTRYGCNFMTTTDEAARIVRLVDHPAIRMQFDTGTVTINREDPVALLARHAGIVGHVHASEPDLVTLGDGNADHPALGAAIRACLPRTIVTIEMVGAPGTDHPALIARAVDLAQRAYGIRTSSGPA
ncbi:MAG TPA: TIM barrel protein [Burkholderiaceae bacterium]|nr:TIM barrel protein [Burkholderiaceae bacterium]